MDIIYNLIFFVIHNLVFYIITLKDYFYRLYWCVKELLDGRLLPVLGVQSVLSKTKSLTSFCEKLPCHIGIVINEDDISIQQIANLIIWSLSIGIQHMSIYDANGIIKSKAHFLYNMTIKYKDKYFNKASSNFKITFHSSEKLELRKDTKNGHIFENELHVSILCWKDGKVDIVNAVRTISQHVLEKKLLTKDINKTQFKKYLNALSDSPDPDLILCFGRGSSLVGYLPWHIHLSEIIFEPSHHWFQLSQFTKALEAYNKCQQRFGK